MKIKRDDVDAAKRRTNEVLSYISRVMPASRPAFIVILLPFWVKSAFAYLLKRAVGDSLPPPVYDLWSILDAPICCRDDCGHVFDFGARAAYWVRTLADYDASFGMIGRLVNEGDVCVDVGAHVGLLAVHMASKAKRVIAVEPEPRNLRRLYHNKALNRLGNLTIFPAAASDHEGTAVLNTSALEGYHSIAFQPQAFEKRLEVPSITLKHLLEAQQVDHLGLLKVDVEGAEKQVLDGLGDWLDPSRIRTMLIEVWAGNIDLLDSLREKWASVEPVSDYGVARDYLVQ